MQKIIDALTLQKRESEDTLNKKYVPRSLKLVDVDKPITKVIIGPRRAGKSFFALHETSRVPGFGYLNFDDEILYKVDDYNLLVESAKTVYSNPKILLLDEVQNLKDWELFVNRLQRQSYNLIITGSNSKLLSRELSTHLTGRYLSFIIFPFSFAEYLRFFAAELTAAEKTACFTEYSQKGGFPEPLVKSLEYKNYLNSLYDSLLYKDITLRHNLKSPKALQDLASYLIANTGNLISYNRLTRFTQIRSIHTIMKYIDFLEEAFLFFTVKAFSYKRKEQVKSPKKIFAIDNGFAYAKSGGFSPNIGRLFENIAAIELKKRELQGYIELYYYKNPQGYEVDFVIKEGTRIAQLIQVSHDLSSEKTKQREIRALLHASKESGCGELLVLTDNYEAEEDVEWFGFRGKIRFKSLWKWLLESSSYLPPE
jgi:hypothetical protein